MALSCSEKVSFKTSYLSGMTASRRMKHKLSTIAGGPQRAPSSPLTAAGPHVPPWTPRPSNSPAGPKFSWRLCPQASCPGLQCTSSAPAVERCSGRGRTLTGCCRSSKRSCTSVKTQRQKLEIDRETAGAVFFHASDFF